MALLSTTIGAYPKPDYTPITDWFQAGEGPDMHDPTGAYVEQLAVAGDASEALFVRATEEAGRDQVAAGIDIPTDGEIRRENYIHYHCRHLDGIDFSRLTTKVVRQGAYSCDLPTITGPIKFRNRFLSRDFKVAQSATDAPVKLTMPGPMTIADTVANDFYDDERKLGRDLAEALNVEIRALADAGCRWIQVDEPVFARKPDQALDYGIEHLDRCFHGVPESVQRVVHMCCGYPDRLDRDDYPKADPAAYFQLAGAVDDSVVDAVSIEDAHRPNDLSLLERYRKTKVILGVVAIAKSRIEQVDEIRDRLGAALEHIDAARLIAAPDCGLALLGRDRAQRKLRNLCAAAHAL